jgi:hypothetical protein
MNPDIAQKTPLSQHMRDQQTNSPCPGKVVANVDEDIGVFVTGCPACGARFVYSFSLSKWIPEEVFEQTLRANPPKVAGL